MFKKLILTILTVFLLGVNANAGSDGELILKKNQPAEVKDCFETLNRATFAFNHIRYVCLNQLQVFVGFAFTS